VIATPLRYDPEAPLERRAGTRAGRTAVLRRRARSRRERYATLTRIFVAFVAFVLVVVLYLGLMANVMRLNYELAHLGREKAELLDATALGDDQIAAAESSERLRTFARRLGMHEPATFAAVTLRPDPPAEAHVAFLPWLK
jgi:hypothetical protein